MLPPTRKFSVKVTGGKQCIGALPKNMLAGPVVPSSMAVCRARKSEARAFACYRRMAEPQLPELAARRPTSRPR
jgi:hypothetical protein